MDIYLISHCSRKIYTPFFRRKVCQRTSHRIHHFTSAKFLKFQETFYKKFLVFGFGAEAPTDNAHKKARRRCTCDKAGTPMGVPSIRNGITFRCYAVFTFILSFLSRKCSWNISSTSSGSGINTYPMPW